MKNEKTSHKKNDFILILVILILALSVFAIRFIMTKKDAGSIQIKVAGKVIGSYSLSEDREIKVNNGTNIIEIKDGEAYMKEADCPDQICVNHKPISANLESIICLPNKVVIEVTSDNENELDGMTN